MKKVNNWSRNEAAERDIPVARDLCERALSDAKARLHPLLINTDVNRLDRRSEFLQTFRNALEKRIAATLALWQPNVQSVFRFDNSRAAHDPTWDGKIHLLVKVPHLSDVLKAFEKRLDVSLLTYLKQMGWSRFQMQQSVLDVQQVTVHELQHGISYGAMFCAVHSVPAKIWPVKR